MNLYLRLLYTIFISWRQGPSALTEEHVLRFRTWPHDLDVNLHMNNGRYLTLMDLGRTQLMIRLGFAGRILKSGWMPVVGTAHLRFRRSLKPWRTFELRTRVVAWDEKWFFLEQGFYCRGELMATGLVKGLFRRKGGTVPTAEILRNARGGDAPPGPIPAVFDPGAFVK